MVELWVRVAEEEGQRHCHDGGDVAGELEAVDGFPVWIGEENQEGWDENPGDNILEEQNKGHIINDNKSLDTMINTLHICAAIFSPFSFLSLHILDSSPSPWSLEMQVQEEEVRGNKEAFEKMRRPCVRAVF